jgi:hypothetical protein
MKVIERDPNTENHSRDARGMESQLSGCGILESLTSTQRLSPSYLQTIARVHSSGGQIQVKNGRQSSLCIADSMTPDSPQNVGIFADNACAARSTRSKYVDSRRTDKLSFPFLVRVGGLASASPQEKRPG